MELRLDNARISFAQGLWNPSAAVENGTKKYNCDFIITDETKVLKRAPDGKGWVPTTIGAAQTEVVVESFKGDKAKAKEWFDDLQRNQKSVRDGNKNKNKAGDVREGYEGCTYVHATSKSFKPVYNADRTAVKDEQSSPIFSGCYVSARVDLYVNRKAGQIGVFASLAGTQFLREGDRIGGGGSTAGADEFEDASAGADAEEFA